MAVLGPFLRPVFKPVSSPLSQRCQGFGGPRHFSQLPIVQPEWQPCLALSWHCQARHVWHQRPASRPPLSALCPVGRVLLFLLLPAPTPREVEGPPSPGSPPVLPRRVLPGPGGVRIRAAGGARQEGLLPQEQKLLQVRGGGGWWSW